MNEMTAAPTQEARSATVAKPVWMETLGTGLHTHAHLVLSGNIHDLFPVDRPGGAVFLPLDRALRAELAAAGIETVLTFDPVDGPGLYPGPDAAEPRPLQADGTTLRRADGTAETLVEMVRMVSASAEVPAALLIRHASHLAEPGGAGLRRLRVALDRIGRAPPPRPVRRGGPPARNPVLWLLDAPGDLPEWFVARHPGMRQIRVDLPDLETRYAHARTLAPRFDAAPRLAEAARAAAVQQMAMQTGGMTLREMEAVAALACHRGLGLDRAGEAIRAYRTGARRNPWDSPLLRERLRRGAADLGARVKGQDQAVGRTLQILTRSVLGLSGAQTGARLARPRGVLFFAGPTGVGKTELAKAVTELLFGDTGMCHRFDMSEFTSERSIARLIGAPPGYAGHEQGGELTNALRQRPFAVVLFDEIEKAHPRILDMFLQILDDGRLTDSRGETSYFSDAIVIFTSNVGILGTDTSTNMGMAILPSDSYAALHRKLMDGIRAHFVKELRRPELLNRIGQNVVAFSFIQPGAAKQIFEAAVARVLATVRAELGIAVTLAPEARQALADLCLHVAMEGGRGIMGRVETHLVNPLAEALLGHLDATALTVTALETVDGTARLSLRPD